MASIFTRIVCGEISSYKIAEDDRYYAFLDINPITKGHTLVIPKEETDYIFDLSDEVLSGLHVFAKKVARAVEKTIPCKRIAVLVSGLEVPHAHVHLIPLNRETDTNITNPKLKLPPEEMQEIAERIKANF